MAGKDFRLDFGLLGALAGGFAGYWLYAFALKYGFYALVLPGGLMGLACGASARWPSQARGVVCGVLALLAGLFSEWWERPFNKDESLKFFVSHLQDLTPVTWVMVALGGVLGYWWGKDAFGPFVAYGKPPSAKTEV
jgi:hypothetical protein